MKNNCFIDALKNYINTRSNAYCPNTKYINYSTLTDFIFTDMILCNNIEKYSNNWDLELGEEYNEEENEYIDIYQYYIVNVDDWRLEEYKEYLEENKKESDFILWYDNDLDIYILGVSHCGTGWSCVPTNIEIK